MFRNRIIVIPRIKLELRVFGFFLILALMLDILTANAQITASIIGADPDEGFGDLDVVSVYCGNNTTYLEVNITVASTITNKTGVDKYWAVQIDSDLDSANNGTWDYEYVAVIRLNGSGVLTAALYNSTYGYIEDLTPFGGNGTSYVGVYIPLADIGGKPEYYFRIYTQNTSGEVDHAPLNDTSTAEPLGDYYICHLTMKAPIWSVKQPDPTGDVNVSELDITWLNATLNSSGLYLGLTLNGTIPWYGGEETAIYEFFIDADNNTSTGYSIGGIGADYLVEMSAGYIPRLYEYTGNGTTWSWSLISLIDYLKTPGGTHELLVYVPSSKASFSQEVAIVGYTTRSVDWLYDTTSPEVVPIPEPTIVSIIVISAIIVVFYLSKYKKKRKGE